METLLIFILLEYILTLLYRLAFSCENLIDVREKETVALLLLFGMSMADTVDLKEYTLPPDSINRIMNKIWLG